MAKSRERIYIVPRRAGLVLALMTFALLMIFALGFVMPPDRTFPPALGIALLVAGLVAMIQSNENLRGVEVTSSRTSPTAAGEPAWIELVVRNGGSRERIGLEVRRGLRWRTAWNARNVSSAGISVLGAGQAATVRLPIPTTRRGRFAVPGVWVTSIIPVGLFFAWKSFEAGGHYFVYPRPRGLPLDRTTGRGELAGEEAGGGNEDVSGHRPYEPGDPLSRMDWRVFARTGKVVVRTLEDGQGSEVMLRWEDTRFLEDTEARLEQLSCWIDQCTREARPFRLVLHGAREDLGSRNLTACLEALATFAPDRL